MKKLPEGLYRRNKSKYYWIKIGKVRESTKTSDLNIARAFYNRRWAEIHHGDIGVTRKCKVSDFVKEFEIYHKTKTVPRVYATDISRVHIFIKKAKPYLLTDITYSMISEFLSSLYGELSPKTRKGYRQILKSFIDYAIKCGYLKENPVTKTDVPKLEKKRPFFFTKEQIDLMLTKAPEHLKTVLMLSLYTGMRIGEIMALKWGQIDFNAGLVYIDKAKSKRFRAVPIQDNLRKYLSSLHTKRTGYVVTRADGDPYEYREGPKKAFKTLLMSCGIDVPKGVLFHALRHSCASWLVMSGASLYAVSKILGHTDAKTTEIYAHLAPDFLKSEMSKLSF